MGKAALVTPLYLSVAWALMISYQLYTQTAVTTVTNYIDMFWPSVGAWLVFRMDMLIFIHAFAWVFLVSSVIPSAILGKDKGVLTQFIICLTLTFSAFIVQDALATIEGRPIDQIFSLSIVFSNPLLALGYLSLPYLLMVGSDIHSRRKRKKTEKMEKITAAYLKNAAAADEKLQEEKAFTE